MQNPTASTDSPHLVYCLFGPSGNDQFVEQLFGVFSDRGKAQVASDKLNEYQRADRGAIQFYVDEWNLNELYGTLPVF